MTVKDVNKQTTLDELMASFTESEESVCQLAMDQVREDGGTSGQQMAACAAAVRGMRGEGDSDDVERSLEVKKNTIRDLERALQEAIQVKYGDSEDNRYLYVEDLDDSYVYFTVSGVLYREGYTASQGQADLLDDRSEANRETLYIVADDNTSELAVERGFKQKISAFVSKHFGGSRKKSPILIKQFSDEEMIEYAPLYNPADSPDLVGDAMSQDTIDSMVSQFNKAIEDGVQLENLGHAAPISKAWKYQEVFTSPWPSCMVGDTEVVKGQPVLVTKYYNQRAWELRKEGRIKGPSIGGRGTFRKVEDDS